MAKEEVDNQAADKALDDALDGLGVSNADSRPKDESSVADSRELSAKPVDEAKPDKAESKPDKGDDKADKEGDGSDGAELTTLQRRTAEQFNIGEDRIAAWGENAADILDEMGRHWSRKMSEIGRKQAKPKTGEAQDGQEQRKARATAPHETADADLPDLTADDAIYDDPAKHNQHRAYTRALANRVARLEASLAREETQRAQRQDREFFSELAKDYPDYGPDAEKAKAVRIEADQIMAGYMANGTEIDRREALDRAWSFLALDVIKEGERDKVRKAQDARRRQRSFRPSTRTGGRQVSAEEAENDRLDDAGRRILGHALPD